MFSIFNSPSPFDPVADAQQKRQADHLAKTAEIFAFLKTLPTVERIALVLTYYETFPLPSPEMIEELRYLSAHLDRLADKKERKAEQFKKWEPKI